MDPVTAGALIQGGTQLVGGALGSKGANRAAKTQQQTADKAMAYQREMDAKEEARYREQEAKLEAQWNAEQARLAPYRQAAESLLGQNANRLGIAFTPSSQSRQMPAGWAPSTSGKSRTLSSLAGTGYVPPGMEAPVLEAPKLSLSDILNNRWTSDRRVS